MYVWELIIFLFDIKDDSSCFYKFDIILRGKLRRVIISKYLNGHTKNKQKDSQKMNYCQSLI